MVRHFIYIVFFFSLLSLSAQGPQLHEDLEIHEDKKKKVDKVETEEIDNPEEILKINIAGQFADKPAKIANFGLRKEGIKSGEMPRIYFYALLVIAIFLTTAILYRMTHFLLFVKAKYMDHGKD